MPVKVTSTGAQWMTGRAFGLVACASLIGVACSSAPAGPTQASAAGPDDALVTDAAAYWTAVLGLPVSIAQFDGPPRILFRSGLDGLGSADGRGLIDGTDSENWATSALVVVRPSVSSRRLYRHEMGHALGFLEHSPEGLMSTGTGSDTLSERERNMMVALYSLPAGTRVEQDGTWQAPDGVSGKLDNSQTSRDIVEFNIQAPAGAFARKQGVTCRWRDPVRVYVMR